MASVKIKVGVISTANIANKVVKACQSSSLVQVVCVGSRTEASAKAFAEKNNIPRFYGSYEAVLDDPEVDFVYIPLPTSMHKEWTIKAAKKGKHVLCEKPVAPNAQDAKEMIQVCQQHNVQFMDGVMWSHSERAKVVKEYINTKIGGAVGVNTRFTWLNDNLQDIRHNKELEPLGALGDLGMYCIRAILFAFNFELPIKVSGTGHNPRANDGNHSFTGTLWFSNGRYAVFDCSFGIATRQAFEISGPTGSILIDDFVVPFISSIHDFGPTPNYTTNLEFQYITFPGKSQKITVPCPISQEQQMVEDMAKLVSDIKFGKKTADVFWPEISLKTQIVIDHLIQSEKEQKEVTVKAL